MPDIFKLDEKINFDWYETLKKSRGKNSRPAALDKYVNKIKPKKNSTKKINLPFYGLETRTHLQPGAIYPILSAFRMLLDENYEFIFPPINIWNEIKKELIEKYEITLKNHAYSLNKVGKDRMLWISLQGEVKNHRLEKANKALLKDRETYQNK